MQIADLVRPDQPIPGDFSGPGLRVDQISATAHCQRLIARGALCSRKVAGAREGPDRLQGQDLGVITVEAGVPQREGVQDRLRGVRQQCRSDTAHNSAPLSRWRRNPTSACLLGLRSCPADLWQQFLEEMCSRDYLQRGAASHRHLRGLQRLGRGALQRRANSRRCLTPWGRGVAGGRRQNLDAKLDYLVWKTPASRRRRRRTD